MLVVAIALKDSRYADMVRLIEQIKTQRAIVVAVATEGDMLITAKADHVLYIPHTPPLLSPIVAVIPLQLLAYHLAAQRGVDVDRPRHLVKSVTLAQF
jgi:glucosamine--fructose-6-phosphate aminotransferase (isomerizing)